MEEDGMKDELQSVSVPDPFLSIFLRAQDYVNRYFQDRAEDPRNAMIKISGERYILVRAASMSRELFTMVASLYQDRGPEEAQSAASGFLFDIAHALGKADALSFHSKMQVTDPIEKLSAGPIHFAYTGWAFVRIFEESHPSPDEEYYLIYDHPFSFEAEEWIKERGRVDFPVCLMNAGYSSGWCEESFGIPLVAVEVECRARGDENCRFIMAPPARIEEHIAGYPGHARDGAARSGTLSVPEFFQRKRLEDELRMSEETARALLDASKDRALLFDTGGTILALNETAAASFGRPAEAIVGSNAFEIIPPDLARSRRALHEEVIRSGRPVRFEDRRDERWLDTTIHPVFDEHGKVARVAVYSRDITDLRTAEEQRLEKEKLKSVLEVTGAICHELNQPLTALSGYVELIATSMGEGSPEKERIVQMSEQIQRMSGIMAQLMKITRYETREYVDGTKIVDIEKSSG